MFASVIDIKFKPGTRDQYLEFSKSVETKLEGVPGIKEFTVVDKGDDTSMVFVAYNSKEDWEAAAPKAQELMGGLADMVTEMPERAGGEVVVNHIY